MGESDCLTVAMTSFGIAVWEKFSGLRSVFPGGQSNAGIASGVAAPAGSFNKSAVAVLQLVVGSIVTFGGYAFISFANNPTGSELGAFHFTLGVAGLLAGFAALKTRSVPVKLLLAVNGATIAYSILSEYFIEAGSLLPPFAAQDSLVGTAFAVLFSVAVVYLLRPEA